MKGRYESIPEVLAGLKKRGLLGDQDSVITTMDRLGIHCPLDDADLSELLDFLSLGNLKRDHRRARLARVLASSEWKRDVTQARKRLDIPGNGITEGVAKTLCDDLVDCWGCRRLSTVATAKTKKPIWEFWGSVLIQSGKLCSHLSIDPAPLYKLGEKLYSGKLDPLMHVGKFFYPESRFFFGGQELPLEPQPHHRVVAHLLWDLPLSAEHLTPPARASVLAGNYCPLGRAVSTTRLITWSKLLQLNKGSLHGASVPVKKAFA